MNHEFIGDFVALSEVIMMICFSIFCHVQYACLVRVCVCVCGFLCMCVCVCVCVGDHLCCVCVCESGLLCVCVCLASCVCIFGLSLTHSLIHAHTLSKVSSKQ